MIITDMPKGTFSDNDRFGQLLVQIEELTELYKKKMMSPFTPKVGDNFDKKYCEGVEKIGNETQERYRYYMSKEKYNYR